MRVVVRRWSKKQVLSLGAIRVVELRVGSIPAQKLPLAGRVDSSVFSHFGTWRVNQMRMVEWARFWCI
jgi:hypothetical protein